VFELHAGSLALHLRSSELAGEVSVVTQDARLRPLVAGRYRVDRHDLTTLAGTERGELLVDGPDGWLVGSGRRVEVWRDGDSRTLRQAWATPANDEFARWVDSAERDDERLARAGSVSPEMTGAEDLDRHGRWDRHPEIGWVWLPYTVAPGWAPYRHGRWAWVRPWGWIWIDAAPWGFAPFHYGRWLNWGGRWVWSPGAHVPRQPGAPVFLPAPGRVTAPADGRSRIPEPRGRPTTRPADRWPQHPAAGQVAQQRP
jgi:hypothetical protein